MEQQQLLFDPSRRTWVDRVWMRVDPLIRRDVVAILAEMARGTIASNGPTRKKKAVKKNEFR